MSQTITIIYDTKEPQIIEAFDLQLEVSCYGSIAEFTFSTYTSLLSFKNFNIDFRDFNKYGTEWKEIRCTSTINGKPVCIRLTNRLGRLLFFKEISTDGATTYQTETEDYEVLPIDLNQEKGEEKLSNIVFVRFASNRGVFALDSKIYPYEIIDKELYDKLQIGDIINIKELRNNTDRYLKSCDYTPPYKDTDIRVEGKTTVNEKDIPYLIDKKEWKIITKAQIFENEFGGEWIKNFIEKNEVCVNYNSSKSKLRYDYTGLCGENISIDYDALKRQYINEVINPKNCDNLLSNALKSLVDHNGFVNNASEKELFITSNDLNMISSTASLTDCCINFQNGSNIEVIKNKEEKNNMSEIFNNIFNDVDFGKLTTNKIKYSINGVAFADKSGKFFVYNDNRAIDVTGMTIEAPMFAMPVAVNQIQPNDVVRFKGDYVIVKELVDDGVKVVNPIGGDVKTIIPQVNIFGFNYMTKVINPFESFANTANENTPFGNMMPLMMFSDITKGNDGDMIKFLMMSQMMGNNTNMNQMLPFIFMSKDGKDNDFLTMMLMSQMCGGNNIFNFNTAPAQDSKE